MIVAGRRPPTAQIRVVVVEDHPPVRQGLELLLPRQGFALVGAASSCEEGARMIVARLPDVALVDIQLGDGSGTDLAKTVAAAAPAIAIVLYTASINRAVIEEAVNSGARALVLKMSPVAHLADAIRAAAAGRTYVDAAVAKMADRSLAKGIRRISRREAQVLGLLAGGLTTEQVASELYRVRRAARPPAS